MSAQGHTAACLEEAGLFERVMSLETREQFAARVRGRSTPLSEERDAACVEYVMSEQCVRDLERLREGDFFLDYPTRISVPKSDSDRRRVLYVFKGGNDHSLMRLIAYGLRPVCRRLPDTLYSFRPDRTSVDMVKDACRANRDGSRYVLKADIRDYACSIDPETLLTVISPLLKGDPELLSFFSWLLRRGKCYEQGVLTDCDAGALPGAAASNFFMAAYLIDMDEAIASSEGCVFYGRYSDDIVAFFDTEEHALEGRRLLIDEIARKKLAFNMDKCSFFKPGDRIELLGFELEGGEIDPGRRSVDRVKKRLRRCAQEVSKRKRTEGLTADEAGRLIIEAVDRTFGDPRDSLRGLTWNRWAFPVITRVDALKELDECAQKCIRYVMTGTWGKAQYRVRYSKLRELGYRPQVSGYYDQGEDVS